MGNIELPIPPHFKPEKTSEVWRVDYQNIAKLASDWAKQNEIQPASHDDFKICLIAVDVQNTFCIPGFELFVGGRSGTGAVDDNIMLAQFIYRNLNRITEIVPTMDTHQGMQIFHGIFFVNDNEEHPAPYTQISVNDITEGKYENCSGQYESVQADQFDGDDIGRDQAGDKNGHNNHKPRGNFLIRKRFLFYSFIHVSVPLFKLQKPRPPGVVRDQWLRVPTR